MSDDAGQVGLADGLAAPEVGRDLARRLVAGDPDAVALLYDAYGRLVFTIAYRILADRGQAEDAVQTAFTKLWRAAARVDPNRDIRPLLFTITRRAALDLRDADLRRSWTPLQDVDEPAVEDGVEHMALEWQVHGAIDALPAEERTVVRLQHLDGMTHGEIASQLGLPIGTVKSRSARAHRRLLALLTPRADEVGR